MDECFWMFLNEKNKEWYWIDVLYKIKIKMRSIEKYRNDDVYR